MRKQHKETQIPDFKKNKSINPKNFELLLNFLAFLGAVKYSEKYLVSTLRKCLQILKDYEIEDFGRNSKLYVFIKVNETLKAILQNPNIGLGTKNLIESHFLMDKLFDFSLLNLIKLATEN